MKTTFALPSLFFVTALPPPPPLVQKMALYSAVQPRVLVYGIVKSSGLFFENLSLRHLDGEAGQSSVEKSGQVREQ